MFSKSCKKKKGKKKKKKEGPPVVASLMLISCQVAEIIQRRFVASAKLLWPCIKVKVIGTCMNVYGMHTSTVISSVNAVA